MLLLACKKTAVRLLDNAGWIISEILNIFFIGNRINQQCLPKTEASRHVVYFKVVRLTNYFKNSITSKIKTGYYLALLTSDTMKLLESIKMIKDKHFENVPHINEVVLLHYNVINSYFQHDSFGPNKSIVKLLDISPKNFIFLKTFNSEFSYTEVTDQYS